KFKLPSELTRQKIPGNEGGCPPPNRFRVDLFGGKGTKAGEWAVGELIASENRVYRCAAMMRFQCRQELSSPMPDGGDQS
ncbi:UNVERIFIED_CONTAM: hypothetical protein Sindi_1837800, partial [Sesamum indicum]